MRISDWSSDVCSSDLPAAALRARHPGDAPGDGVGHPHDRRGAARRVRPERSGGCRTMTVSSSDSGSVEPHDAIDVIRAKRDGRSIPEPALPWLIDASTRGNVPNPPMSAFAIGVLTTGLGPGEL